MSVSLFSVPLKKRKSVDLSESMEQQRSAYGEDSEISSTIGDLKNRQNAVQTRTFTRWVNCQLSQHPKPGKMDDVVKDVKDGVNLCKLLEVLSGEKVVYDTPRWMQRPVFFNNVNSALEFLKSKKIKLVSTNAADIVDGNCDIVLGLIWTIILHFQIEDNARLLSEWGGTTVGSSSSMESVGNGEERPSSSSRFRLKTPSSSGKVILLKWVKSILNKPFGLHLSDFGKSWRDGVAFCALVQSAKNGLIDMDAVRNFGQPRENLELAFGTAEYHLNIPRLLDPDDVDTDNPDERSIMTYITQFMRFLVTKSVTENGSESTDSLATIRLSVEEIELQLGVSPSINSMEELVSSLENKRLLLGKLNEAESALNETEQHHVGDTTLEPDLLALRQRIERCRLDLNWQTNLQGQILHFCSTYAEMCQWRNDFEPKLQSLQQRSPQSDSIIQQKILPELAVKIDTVTTIRSQMDHLDTGDVRRANLPGLLERLSGSYDEMYMFLTDQQSFVTEQMQHQRQSEGSLSLLEKLIEWIAAVVEVVNSPWNAGGTSRQNLLTYLNRLKQLNSEVPEKQSEFEEFKRSLSNLSNPPFETQDTLIQIEDCLRRIPKNVTAFEEHYDRWCLVEDRLLHLESELDQCEKSREGVFRNAGAGLSTLTSRLDAVSSLSAECQKIASDFMALNCCDVEMLRNAPELAFDASDLNGRIRRFDQDLSDSTAVYEGIRSSITVAIECFQELQAIERNLSDMKSVVDKIRLVVIPDEIEPAKQRLLELNLEPIKNRLQAFRQRQNTITFPSSKDEEQLSQFLTAIEELFFNIDSVRNDKGLALEKAQEQFHVMKSFQENLVRIKESLGPDIGPQEKDVWKEKVRRSIQELEAAIPILNDLDSLCANSHLTFCFPDTGAVFYFEQYNFDILREFQRLLYDIEHRGVEKVSDSVAEDEWIKGLRDRLKSLDERCEQIPHNGSDLPDKQQICNDLRFLLQDCTVVNENAQELLQECSRQETVPDKAYKAQVIEQLELSNSLLNRVEERLKFQKLCVDHHLQFDRLLTDSFFKLNDKEAWLKEEALSLIDYRSPQNEQVLYQEISNLKSTTKANLLKLEGLTEVLDSETAEEGQPRIRQKLTDNKARVEFFREHLDTMEETVKTAYALFFELETLDNELDKLYQYDEQSPEDTFAELQDKLNEITEGLRVIWMQIESIRSVDGREIRVPLLDQRYQEVADKLKSFSTRTNGATEQQHAFVQFEIALKSWQDRIHALEQRQAEILNESPTSPRQSGEMMDTLKQLQLDSSELEQHLRDIRDLAILVASGPNSDVTHRAEVLYQNEDENWAAFKRRLTKSLSDLDMLAQLIPLVLKNCNEVEKVMNDVNNKLDKKTTKTDAKTLDGYLISLENVEPNLKAAMDANRQIQDIRPVRKMKDTVDECESKFLNLKCELEHSSRFSHEKEDTQHRATELLNEIRAMLEQLDDAIKLSNEFSPETKTDIEVVLQSLQFQSSNVESVQRAIEELRGLKVPKKKMLTKADEERFASAQKKLSEAQEKILKLLQLWSKYYSMEADINGSIDRFWEALEDFLEENRKEFPGEDLKDVLDTVEKISVVQGDIRSLVPAPCVSDSFETLKLRTTPISGVLPYLNAVKAWSFGFEPVNAKLRDIANQDCPQQFESLCEEIEDLEAVESKKPELRSLLNHTVELCGPACSNAPPAITHHFKSKADAAEQDWQLFLSLLTSRTNFTTVLMRNWSSFNECASDIDKDLEQIEREVETSPSEHLSELLQKVKPKIERLAQLNLETQKEAQVETLGVRSNLLAERFQILTRALEDKSKKRYVIQLWMESMEVIRTTVMEYTKPLETRTAIDERLNQLQVVSTNLEDKAPSNLESVAPDDLTSLQNQWAGLKGVVEKTDEMLRDCKGKLGKYDELCERLSQELALVSDKLDHCQKISDPGEKLEAVKKLLCDQKSVESEIVCPLQNLVGGLEQEVGSAQDYEKCRDMLNRHRDNTVFLVWLENDALEQMARQERDANLATEIQSDMDSMQRTLMTISVTPASKILQVSENLNTLRGMDFKTLEDRISDLKDSDTRIHEAVKDQFSALQDTHRDLLSRHLKAKSLCDLLASDLSSLDNALGKAEAGLEGMSLSELQTSVSESKRALGAVSESNVELQSVMCVTEPIDWLRTLTIRLQTLENECSDRVVKSERDSIKNWLMDKDRLIESLSVVEGTKLEIAEKQEFLASQRNELYSRQSSNDGGDDALSSRFSEVLDLINQKDLLLSERMRLWYVYDDRVGQLAGWSKMVKGEIESLPKIDEPSDRLNRVKRMLDDQGSKKDLIEELVVLCSELTANDPSRAPECIEFTNALAEHNGNSEMLEMQRETLLEQVTAQEAQKLYHELYISWKNTFNDFKGRLDQVTETQAPKTLEEIQSRYDELLKLNEHKAEVSRLCDSLIAMYQSAKEGGQVPNPKDDSLQWKVVLERLSRVTDEHSCALKLWQVFEADVSQFESALTDAQSIQELDELRSHVNSLAGDVESLNNLICELQELCPAEEPVARLNAAVARYEGLCEKSAKLQQAETVELQFRNLDSWLDSSEGSRSINSAIGGSQSDVKSRLENLLSLKQDAEDKLVQIDQLPHDHPKLNETRKRWKSLDRSLGEYIGKLQTRNQEWTNYQEFVTECENAETNLRDNINALRATKNGKDVSQDENVASVKKDLEDIEGQKLPKLDDLAQVLEEADPGSCNAASSIRKLHLENVKMFDDVVLTLQEAKELDRMKESYPAKVDYWKKTIKDLEEPLKSCETANTSDVIRQAHDVIGELAVRVGDTIVPQWNEFSGTHKKVLSATPKKKQKKLQSDFEGLERRFEKSVKGVKQNRKLLDETLMILGAFESKMTRVLATVENAETLMNDPERSEKEVTDVLDPLGPDLEELANLHTELQNLKEMPIVQDEYISLTQRLNKLYYDIDEQQAAKAKIAEISFLLDSLERRYQDLTDSVPVTLAQVEDMIGQIESLRIDIEKSSSWKQDMSSVPGHLLERQKKLVASVKEIQVKYANLNDLCESFADQSADFDQHLITLEMSADALSQDELSGALNEAYPKLEALSNLSAELEEIAPQLEPKPSEKLESFSTRLNNLQALVEQLNERASIQEAFILWCEETNVKVDSMARECDSAGPDILESNRVLCGNIRKDLDDHENESKDLPVEHISGLRSRLDNLEIKLKDRLDLWTKYRVVVNNLQSDLKASEKNWQDCGNVSDPDERLARLKRVQSDVHALENELPNLQNVCTELGSPAAQLPDAKQVCDGIDSMKDGLALDEEEAIGAVKAKRAKEDFVNDCKGILDWLELSETKTRELETPALESKLVLYDHLDTSSGLLKDAQGQKPEIDRLTGVFAEIKDGLNKKQSKKLKSDLSKASEKLEAQVGKLEKANEKFISVNRLYDQYVILQSELAEKLQALDDSKNEISLHEYSQRLDEISPQVEEVSNLNAEINEMIPFKETERMSNEVVQKLNKLTETYSQLQDQEQQRREFLAWIEQKDDWLAHIVVSQADSEATQLAISDIGQLRPDVDTLVLPEVFLCRPEKELERCQKAIAKLGTDLNEAEMALKDRSGCWDQYAYLINQIEEKRTEIGEAKQQLAKADDVDVKKGCVAQIENLTIELEALNEQLVQCCTKLYPGQPIEEIPSLKAAAKVLENPGERKQELEAIKAGVLTSEGFSTDYKRLIEWLDLCEKKSNGLEKPALESKEVLYDCLDTSSGWLRDAQKQKPELERLSGVFTGMKDGLNKKQAKKLKSDLNKASEKLDTQVGKLEKANEKFTNVNQLYDQYVILQSELAEKLQALDDSKNEISLDEYSQRLDEISPQIEEVSNLNAEINEIIPFGETERMSNEVVQKLNKLTETYAQLQDQEQQRREFLTWIEQKDDWLAGVVVSQADSEGTKLAISDIGQLRPDVDTLVLPEVFLCRPEKELEQCQKAIAKLGIDLNEAEMALKDRSGCWDQYAYLIDQIEEKRTEIGEAKQQLAKADDVDVKKGCVAQIENLTIELEALNEQLVQCCTKLYPGQHTEEIPSLKAAAKLLEDPGERKQELEAIKAGVLTTEGFATDCKSLMEWLDLCEKKSSELEKPALESKEVLYDCLDTSGGWLRDAQNQKPELERLSGVLTGMKDGLNKKQAKKLKSDLNKASEKLDTQVGKLEKANEKFTNVNQLYDQYVILQSELAEKLQALDDSKNEISLDEYSQRLDEISPQIEEVSNLNAEINEIIPFGETERMSNEVVQKLNKLTETYTQLQDQEQQRREFLAWIEQKDDWLAGVVVSQADSKATQLAIADIGQLRPDVDSLVLPEVFLCRPEKELERCQKAIAKLGTDLNEAEMALKDRSGCWDQYAYLIDQIEEKRTEIGEAKQQLAKADDADVKKGCVAQIENLTIELEALNEQLVQCCTKLYPGQPIEEIPSLKAAAKVLENPGERKQELEAIKAGVLTTEGFASDCKCLMEWLDLCEKKSTELEKPALESKEVLYDCLDTSSGWLRDAQNQKPELERLSGVLTGMKDGLNKKQAKKLKSDLNKASEKLDTQVGKLEKANEKFINVNRLYDQYVILQSELAEKLQALDDSKNEISLDEFSQRLDEISPQVEEVSNLNAEINEIMPFKETERMSNEVIQKLNKLTETYAQLQDQEQQRREFLAWIEQKDDWLAHIVVSQADSEATQLAIADIGQLRPDVDTLVLPEVFLCRPEKELEGCQEAIGKLRTDLNEAEMALKDRSGCWDQYAYLIDQIEEKRTEIGEAKQQLAKADDVDVKKGCVAQIENLTIELEALNEQLVQCCTKLYPGQPIEAIPSLKGAAKVIEGSGQRKQELEAIKVDVLNTESAHSSLNDVETALKLWNERMYKIELKLNTIPELTPEGLSTFINSLKQIEAESDQLDSDYVELEKLFIQASSNVNPHAKKRVSQLKKALANAGQNWAPVKALIIDYSGKFSALYDLLIHFNKSAEDLPKRVSELEGSFDTVPPEELSEKLGDLWQKLEFLSNQNAEMQELATVESANEKMEDLGRRINELNAEITNREQTRSTELATALKSLTEWLQKQTNILRECAANTSCSREKASEQQKLIEGMELELLEKEAEVPLLLQSTSEEQKEAYVESLQEFRMALENAKRLMNDIQKLWEVYFAGIATLKAHKEWLREEQAQLAHVPKAKKRSELVFRLISEHDLKYQTVDSLKNCATNLSNVAPESMIKQSEEWIKQYESDTIELEKLREKLEDDSKLEASQEEYASVLKRLQDLLKALSLRLDTLYQWPPGSVEQVSNHIAELTAVESELEGLGPDFEVLNDRSTSLAQMSPKKKAKALKSEESKLQDEWKRSLDRAKEGLIKAEEIRKLWVILDVKHEYIVEKLDGILSDIQNDNLHDVSHAEMTLEKLRGDFGEFVRINSQIQNLGDIGRLSIQEAELGKKFDTVTMALSFLESQSELSDLTAWFENFEGTLANCQAEGTLDQLQKHSQTLENLKAEIGAKQHEVEKFFEKDGEEQNDIHKRWGKLEQNMGETVDAIDGAIDVWKTFNSQESKMKKHLSWIEKKLQSIKKINDEEKQKTNAKKLLETEASKYYQKDQFDRLESSANTIADKLNKDHPKECVTTLRKKYDSLIAEIELLAKADETEEDKDAVRNSISEAFKAWSDEFEPNELKIRLFGQSSPKTIADVENRLASLKELEMKSNQGEMNELLEGVKSECEKGYKVLSKREVARLVQDIQGAEKKQQDFSSNLNDLLQQYVLNLKVWKKFSEIAESLGSKLDKAESDSASMTADDIFQVTNDLNPELKKLSKKNNEIQEIFPLSEPQKIVLEISDRVSELRSAGARYMQAENKVSENDVTTWLEEMEGTVALYTDRPPGSPKEMEQRYHNLSQLIDGELRRKEPSVQQVAHGLPHGNRLALLQRWQRLRLSADKGLEQLQLLLAWLDLENRFYHQNCLSRSRLEDLNSLSCPRDKLAAVEALLADHEKSSRIVQETSDLLEQLRKSEGHKERRQKAFHLLGEREELHAMLVNEREQLKRLVAELPQREPKVKLTIIETVVEDSVKVANGASPDEKITLNVDVTKEPEEAGFNLYLSTSADEGSPMVEQPKSSSDHLDTVPSVPTVEPNDQYFHFNGESQVPSFLGFDMGDSSPRRRGKRKWGQKVPSPPMPLSNIAMPELIRPQGVVYDFQSGGHSPLHQQQWVQVGEAGSSSKGKPEPVEVLTKIAGEEQQDKANGKSGWPYRYPLAFEDPLTVTQAPRSSRGVPRPKGRAPSFLPVDFSDSGPPLAKAPPEHELLAKYRAMDGEFEAVKQEMEAANTEPGWTIRLLRSWITRLSNLYQQVHILQTRVLRSNELPQDEKSRLLSNVQSLFTRLLALQKRLRSKMRSLGAEDFEVLEQELDFASGDEPDTMAQRRRRPFWRRVLRTALPIQALMLLLLGSAAMIPLGCTNPDNCLQMNNLIRSGFPVLNYVNGPPPV